MPALKQRSTTADDGTKRPNQVSEYTVDKIAELVRSEEDPIYFLKTFMKVREPMKGTIPFEPYPYQIEIIESFQKNRNTICCTGRQLGKSTCAAGFLLWKAMFSESSTILICANKQTAAYEIMNRIKFAYENMPDYIRCGVSEYNKGTITFDNGSQIIALATAADSGRGLSISLLYLDEFAFVRPGIAKEFWTAISPVLSAGGGCIVTSTPKNDEDQFAQIWKGAKANRDDYGNEMPGGIGRNGFFAVEVPWTAHPDRDRAWEIEWRAKLGEARFLQEHCCAWVTDDLTLIDPLTLARLTYEAPAFYTGTVRWFRELQANKTYLVGLDPCLGMGQDYAAIQIYQAPEMIQVGEWQHNTTAPKGQVGVLLQTLRFIDDELRQLDDQIGDPDIFWSFENNNTCGGYVWSVIETTGLDRFPGTFVSEKRRPGVIRKAIKGMTTTNNSKVMACTRLKSLVESGRMTPLSQNLLRELKFYVASESSFHAKTGEHDDLVSASIVVVRVLDQSIDWINDTEDLKDSVPEDDYYEEPLPFL